MAVHYQERSKEIPTTCSAPITDCKHKVLPLLTLAPTGAASRLTQVILLVTRGGLLVQKVRLGLVEDRGEVERERYAPLFTQAHCAGVR